MLRGVMARLGADNVSELPRFARLPFTVDLPNASKRRRGAVPRLALPRSLTAPMRRRPLANVSEDLRKLAERLNLLGRTGSAPAGATVSNSPPEKAPSLPLLRDLLRALPNPESATRDDQIAIAHAVKGAATGIDFESGGARAVPGVVGAVARRATRSGP